jgi:CDP-glycerol glycerophosphotransferase
MKKIIYKLLKILYILPIKNNKISFICNRGGSYCCNPKYMAEYINKKYKGKYEIVFFYANKAIPSLANKSWIRWVKFGRLQYVISLMTSKYIVSNITIPDYVPYRKNQVTMCTWHGAAFKAVSTEFNYNFNIFDYFIVENEISRQAFINAYKLKNKVLTIGMPRNDVLISNNINIQEIKNKLKIHQDNKILLYAPTFRDNQEADFCIANFDGIIKALNKKFGGPWIVLLRYHPLQKNRVHSENCIDASAYLDMQELLAASDALITDYSSCMWDFSLTNKPCFIFAPDIERYTKNERGAFVFPFNRTPFPIATNENELIEKIINFNAHSYIDNIKKYHVEQGRFNWTGDATKKSIDILLNTNTK